MATAGFEYIVHVPAHSISLQWPTALALKSILVLVLTKYHCGSPSMTSLSGDRVRTYRSVAQLSMALEHVDSPTIYIMEHRLRCTYNLFCEET